MACSNIRYGPGVTQEVGMDLANLGAKNVGVYTDKNLSGIYYVQQCRRSDWLKEITWLLVANWNAINVRCGLQSCADGLALRWIYLHQHGQCDQIGRFLKVFGSLFFSSKSCPNIWWLFGLFESITNQVKTAFWANLIENCVTFIFKHMVALVNYSPEPILSLDDLGQKKLSQALKSRPNCPIWSHSKWYK